MLTFDEAAHRYYWNGQPVPNVTRALSPLVDYSMVNADVLALAAQKGVAVHKMVELHCKGTLDEASLPEWMRPVLAFWKQFVSETGFQLIASEKRVFHPTYRYAGTLDLRGTMPKSRFTGQGIIDVKRSFMGGKAIGFQTAAYAKADDVDVIEPSGRIQWRGALRLREDQPYRFKPYEDRNDFNAFLTCLAFQKLKESLQ